MKDNIFELRAEGVALNSQSCDDDFSYVDSSGGYTRILNTHYPTRAETRPVEKQGATPKN